MTAIKAVIHRLSGKRDSDPRRRYADAFAITLPPGGRAATPRGTVEVAALKSAYHKRKMTTIKAVIHRLSGKRDSDPRPQPWQGCALPTELFPQWDYKGIKLF